MRVLVTGAAGAIGSTVGPALAGLGHRVRGLDLRVPDDGTTAYALGWVTGDCADLAVVDRAVDGVDAVVHLAGNPGETSLPDALASHVRTTAAVLDAMVEHGVGRIVYASSNHAVGRTERTRLLTTSVRPRPDTFYGVAKVAAEALLSLYADRYAITAVALRIGSFLPEPATVRALSTWLSPADCVRLVAAGLSAADPGFHVVYGVSANTRGWWDLEPGRAIGYEPSDDAEAYADRVAARSEDDDEGAHVGGPFARAAVERPAFDR